MSTTESSSSSSSSTSATPLSNPVSSTRGPIGYSLWFIPDEPVASYCQKQINELQSLYNKDITFLPHITLLGDIFPPATVSQTTVEERTETVLRSVLPTLRSFTVPIKEVTMGQLFYRCVFLLCEKENTIVQLNTAIQNEFGHQETYMPHLSLLYADISTEKREQLCKELNPLIIDQDHLTLIKIKAIELWDTTGRPPVWKQLKVWSLKD